MYRMRIYRDEGDGGAGAGQGGAAGAGQGAGGAGAGSGGDGGSGGEPAKKEMTQAELDALVSGSKKEGAEKLAKQHGFTTADGKADLKAFDAFIADAKKRAEDAKTADEKAEEERKKDRDAREAAEARAVAAETKAAALEAGVDPKKIARAVALIPAYEGETPADKVAAFLAEFPEFKGDGKPLPEGGFGGKTKTTVPDELAQKQAKLRAAAGLAVKA